MKRLLVLAAVLVLAIAAPQKGRSPKPQLDGRIVGGQAIDITWVPYQLSFLFYGSHICGAVLIAPYWVLTAAHCAEGVYTHSVSFRGGSNYHASGGQVVGASYVAIHPYYNSWEFDYDIAVYSTSGYFDIGVSVNTVLLPHYYQNWQDGQRSRVTGWGALIEGGVISPNLQAVSVSIVGLNQCRAAYGVFAVTERMLCAGVRKGARNSCQGDSGGPLTVNNVLAGLASWGYGCGDPNYPGVYTHVGQLRDFISQYTGL